MLGTNNAGELIFIKKPDILRAGVRGGRPPRDSTDVFLEIMRKRK